MNKKEIRNEIEDAVAGIPDKQISAGVYIKTIGYKYLTIINTFETTTTEKIPLEYFDGVTLGEGIDEFRYDNRS